MSSVVCPGRKNVSLRTGLLSSFAHVTQGACTTSNGINEGPSGTCELLSKCQRSTRGVDLGR